MKSKVMLIMFVLSTAFIGLVGCAGSPDRGDVVFYTALGASDAVGVGAIPLKNGYVFRIRDDLKTQFRDVKLLNLGVPGAKADTIRDVVELFLQTGVQPNLITIWTGPNDITSGVDQEEFESNLQSILGQLREKTSADIVIADVPDLTQAPRFIANPSPVVTPERIKAFNEAIERQASAFDVPVVALSKAEIAEECISDLDGFHPSNKGHRRISEFFLKEIRSEIGLAQTLKLEHPAHSGINPTIISWSRR